MEQSWASPRVLDATESSINVFRSRIPKLEYKQLVLKGFEQVTDYSSAIRFFEYKIDLSGTAEYNFGSNPLETSPIDEVAVFRPLPPRNILKQASKGAYRKLVEAGPSSSVAYREFLHRLGSHNKVFGRGMNVFERYLNHETPSTLEDVYSLLHICFATSRSQKGKNSHVSSTRAEFEKNVQALRACLSDALVSIEGPNIYCETYVFDEILEVMQDEIDEAIEWLGKNTNGVFSMNNLVSKMERLQVSRNMLSTTEVPYRQDVVPDKSPSEEGKPPEPGIPVGIHPEKLNSNWLDQVIGPIFLSIFFFFQCVLLSFSHGFVRLQHTGAALYSFLFDSLYTSEPTEDTQSQNELFAAIVEDAISSALSTISEELAKVVASGIYLLREGVVSTLQQFEDYCLKLGKKFCETDSQLVDFKGSLWEGISHCTGETQEHVSDGAELMTNTEHLVVVPARFANPYTQALLETSDVEFSDAKESMPLVDTSSNVDSLEARSFSQKLNETQALLPFDLEVDMVGVAETNIDLDTETGAGEARPAPVISGTTPTCNLGKCNNEVFSSTCNLLRHQRDCHGVKSFPCGFGDCTYRSGRKDNLHRHRLGAHGISKPASRAREKALKRRNSRHV